jgi:hypothetical protein
MSPTVSRVDVSAGISLGAAIVSICALGASIFQARSARRQAEAAERQTGLQEQIHRDSLQPYVYLDVRVDPVSKEMFDLVIENSGPTIATNVKVSIDPPLRSSIDPDVDRWALTRGIVSMPPGRSLSWGFDMALSRGDDYPSKYQVTITGDGPFGPMQQLSYSLDLDDYDDTEARKTGTLKDIAKGITDLAKAVKQGSTTLTSR